MSRIFHSIKRRFHHNSSATAPPSTTANPPPIPTSSKPTQFSNDMLTQDQRRRPSKPDTLMRTNAVYYPNYRIYRGDSESPATLNYNCITHVFYAFANVAPDGGVLLSDEFADLQKDVDGLPNGCIGSFIRLKAVHAHLKVLLSVGGGGNGSEHFEVVAACPVKRDNFARSLHGLVTSSGLDGIDIDWEHPSNPQSGANFLSLLAQIRLYLSDSDYLLTAALPASEWGLRHIDLYQAKDYLDFLNLMAYDFSGAWTPQTGHHAQLYDRGNASAVCGKSGVDYARSRGFPANKIILGVPIYGRSFLNVRFPSTRPPTTASDFLGKAYTGMGGEEGTFEYKDLPRPGTIEVVDTEAVAAYCFGGDGGFVTYDNPETVKLKASWVKEQGLGGLFYWTGTADVRSGPRSLVEQGFTALHGG